MKKYLASLLLILSLPVFSSGGYKLDMNLFLDGKVVSKSKMIVQEGKKAIITQEGANSKAMTKISIIATEGEIQGNKGILLNLEVVHEVGETRKIVARPQVLVSEGKEALFETTDNNGASKMELKVIAKRMTL